MANYVKLTHEDNTYLFAFYPFNFINSEENRKKFPEISTVLISFQEVGEDIKVTSVDYVERLRSHLTMSPLYTELYHARTLAVMEHDLPSEVLKKIAESLSERLLEKELSKSIFYKNLPDINQK